MARRIKSSTSNPGVWSRTNHDPKKPIRGLSNPGARRRRALAILALTRQGFEVPDIADWMDLSEQWVNQLRRQAERFLGSQSSGT